jgi:hypothetical protein
LLNEEGSLLVSAFWKSVGKEWEEVDGPFGRFGGKYFEYVIFDY